MRQAANLGTSTIVIEPSKGIFDLDLKEVWHYRELLYSFALRDISVRYRQTALGAAWAVLQPILTAAVFTMFLGRLAKVPSDGVPYLVFAYVSLVPWQFFANAVNTSSNSLILNQNLLQKVYFPRLVVPLAAVLASLVDFVVAFLVLLGLMAYYRIVPKSSIIALPGFLLLAVATAAAAGLWLSAINVRYRDVRNAVPFLVQFWMFATPVVYPSSLLPVSWRPWFSLNPMTAVEDGFRAAMLGTRASLGPLVWVSVGVVIVLLIAGVVYFRQVESNFADIV
jgi:lipopolysaccharide transport system permease protein